MWFKVKTTSETQDSHGKLKRTVKYYLSDAVDFIEAGTRVMQHVGGTCEIEDVAMMKALKPLGNVKYADGCKVFIVKFAEDFTQDDGTVKTIKYPVPFYANDNTELQMILKLYIEQGLQDMRITTVSETQWDIV